MLRLGCGAWALALVLSCAGAVFAEFAAAWRGVSLGSEAHGGVGSIAAQNVTLHVNQRHCR